MQVLGHEHAQDLVEVTDPPEVQGGGIVTHLVPSLCNYVFNIPENIQLALGKGTEMR